MPISSISTLKRKHIIPGDPNISDWSLIGGIYYDKKNLSLGITVGCKAVENGETPLIIKEVKGEMVAKCNCILSDGACKALIDLKNLGRVSSNMCPNKIKTVASF